jgi:pilus assembly protein CpaB
MGAARIIILSVAAVAAIGLAVVVRGMLAGDPAPAPAPVAQAAAPQTPMTRVLVAKRDLPVGTRLTASDMGWQSWPADSLNPAFITDGSAPKAAPETTADKAIEGASNVAQSMVAGTKGMDNLIGAVVREAIASGEPMVERKVVKGGEGGYLAVVLQPGMRAVGVPVTVESGAGGFILPGDRVDVIQTREVAPPQGATTGDKPRVTEPVVVNVRVLAIDQKTAPEKDSQAIVGAVATLEVTPDAAEALVEAMSRGDLQLALRSYADAGAPSGRVTARTSVGPTVRVFRQTEVTDVAVAR